MADADKKRQRGKKTEASATLTAAMTKVTEYMSDKAKAKTLLVEGKFAMDKSDYVGAIECFSHAVNFNPTYQDLYKMRVQCYKQLNMLSEAYFDYSFLIRLDPHVGSFYCNRALVLAKMKKYDMAIEDADYAIELNANSFHYFSRGSIFAERNLLDKAVEDFTRALTDYQASNDTSIKIKSLHKRAMAYFELSQYESAINDATNIISNYDQNHIAARAIIARSLKMIGELRKAEEQITNVITMENDNPSHFLERGDIRFRAIDKNKCVEAIHDFDSAIRLLEKKLQRAQDASGTAKKKVVIGLRTATSSSMGVANNNTINNNTTAASHSLHTSASLPAIHFNSQTSMVTTTNLLSFDDNQAKVLKYAQSFGGDTMLNLQRAGLDVESAFVQPLALNNPENQNNSGDALMSAHSFQDDPATNAHSPPPFMHSNTMMSHNSNNNQPQFQAGSTGAAAAAAAATIAELEEQLAETLYRRAQAKLLIDCFNCSAGPVSGAQYIAGGPGGALNAPAEGLMKGGSVVQRRPPDLALLEAALDDAMKAATYIPSDDEYQLIISNCFLRLGRFQEAKQQLDFIINRSPNNQRAQFHLAFCLQESGSKRDAIEMLTKIIGSSSQGLANSKPLSVNPGRVMLSTEVNDTTISLARLYECRGTLFHEIQVHKLALTDLGRAIALDPFKAENYFLRADCHSKLGNYEQALADFGIATQYGYKDMFNLLCARGVVLRLLGQSEAALADFNEALRCINLTDRAAIVRISTLTALCMIDLHQYSESCDLLSKCLEHVRSFIDESCEKMRIQAERERLLELQSPSRSTKFRSQRALSVRSPKAVAMNAEAAAASLTGVPSLSPIHNHNHSNKAQAITTGGRHSPDVYSIMTSASRNIGNEEGSNGGVIQLSDLVPLDQIMSLSPRAARARIAAAEAVAKEAKEKFEKNDPHSNSLLQLHIPDHPHGAGDGTGRKLRVDLTAANSNKNSFLSTTASPTSALKALADIPDPPMTLTASRKLEWILLYHQALCLYNQGYHEHVEHVSLVCLHPANSLFAPDEHSVSIIAFYLSLSLVHLGKHEYAEHLLLDDVLPSSWAGNAHTQSLLWFVLGKIKQKLLQHKVAIEYFTNSIASLDGTKIMSDRMVPSMKQPSAANGNNGTADDTTTNLNHSSTAPGNNNAGLTSAAVTVISNNADPKQVHAHAYFRRAWSYKALGLYVEAGNDFEVAKNARPDDPNFAVNYKQISRLEYAQIDSEPDMILLFPALLPNNI